MQYPDDADDLTQLTMEDFVGHSQHLFQQVPSKGDLQSEVDFIHFMLAGSVGPQAVWPLTPFKETLRKDNHIKSKAYDAQARHILIMKLYMLTMNQGTEICVPMHKIPNVALGKVQQRHTPRLYSASSLGVEVSQVDLALICDHCLHPMMAKVILESTDQWLASYATAYTQFRNCFRTLTFSSINIPWYRLEDVTQILLTKLGDEKPAFKDAYFVHKLRGMKNATIHNGSDEYERQLAFKDMSEHVDV
ncbi:uncharacterized protein BJ212DRAFT_1304390 [Suillus subaureus]|uniref:Uncharacterized protein n=1 Tax=Suillus subaureus TaxID=48587 RepID=A0A9P7J5W2_9AGAM|nr:uncharacterized protein BJ212DRAFT_1304390 [Suillus subaureus]KAG1804175.1 hypothetical protein BJ212DRAFT_1304390 [Suillus subaureus]